MRSEADIIRNLQNAFAGSPSGVVGIGDDAAVLPLNTTESYVVSKDILVENKHFRLSYDNAQNLAHKSLHVNLSDIAAMGATPLYVMLGIALPPMLADAWIDEFLAAFAAACKHQNIELIGGDTTASERDLFISITVIGRAANTHIKFRNGAKVGDLICYAGSLGEAHAGLQALEKNIVGLDTINNKSLRPNALAAEGKWFGKQSGVTAMMDVSDGLYVDLSKLIAASQVGAVIDLETFRPSAQLTTACKALKLDPRSCMLTGGEDYALLLTVKPTLSESLARDFEKQFSYPLVTIGKIRAESDIELRDAGKAVPFTGRPFSHFGEL